MTTKEKVLAALDRINQVGSFNLSEPEPTDDTFREFLAEHRLEQSSRGRVSASEIQNMLDTAGVRVEPTGQDLEAYERGLLKW